MTNLFFVQRHLNQFPYGRASWRDSLKRLYHWVIDPWWSESADEDI